MVTALLGALPGGGAMAAEAVVAITAAADAVYAIDGPRAAIVARRIEPGRAALAPPFDVVTNREAGPQPIAVAVVDRRLLAAVCRSGSAWTLETWSLDTPSLEAGGAATQLQSLELGSAEGSSAGVSLAVSPTGGWLAIAGLPPPLAPVQRAAIAGRRLSPPSSRNCPRPAARPTAIVVSPADELVVFEAPSGDGSVAVAFHGLGGRELLRLDTGLESVRGAGFDPADGSLFVAGERRDGAGRVSGLWRLDAALADGRQVIRPVLMAAFDSPRDLVCSSPRAMVLVHGAAEEQVAVIDPADLVPPQNPGAEP